MWVYSIRGGWGWGYGTVEFHACGRWGVVHRHSVPPPHNHPCFAGKGGVSDQQSLHILSFRHCPQSPFLIQRRPNSLSHPSESPLVPPWFLPCGDSLVDGYPHIRQCPQVVARCPFVWLWKGAPQLSEDLVRPRPCLKYGQL